MQEKNLDFFFLEYMHYMQETHHFFIVWVNYVGENVEPLDLEVAAIQSKLIHQIVVVGQVSFLSMWSYILMEDSMMESEDKFLWIDLSWITHVLIYGLIQWHATVDHKSKNFCLQVENDFSSSYGDWILQLFFPYPKILFFGVLGSNYGTVSIVDHTIFDPIICINID